MKPYAIKNRAAGLLLLTTLAILAAGCASGGTSTQVYGSYGYYGGYYPGYDPYYHGDVIVGVPPPPPGGVRPPPPDMRPPAPPHVSQLPSRPLPAPAPRPTPRAAPRGGGRGR